MVDHGSGKMDSRMKLENRPFIVKVLRPSVKIVWKSNSTKQYKTTHEGGDHGQTVGTTTIRGPYHGQLQCPTNSVKFDQLGLTVYAIPS